MPCGLADWRWFPSAPLEPCVRLSSHGSPNLPLVRFLLSNWLNIQASLGDHFRRAIFGSTDVNDPNQWHELAPIIDEYPEPKEALLNAVHSNGNTQIYESVLQFLGRTLPKSQVLLKECLRIINDEGLPTHRWIEIDAAAELLGRDFHGDSEVLAAIRTPPRDPFHRDNRKLWALCEGWPEAEELDKEYVSLKDELDEDWHRLQLGFAQMQLLCAKGSADDVFHAVMAFLDIPHPDLSYSAQSLCRPLFRRIRNDSELQRLLKMRLENPPHPSQAVSIARILFQALSLESDLRSWSDSKAGANTSPVPWPMGTDITRGTVIGEWEAGMEIVFGATRP